MIDANSGQRVFYLFPQQIYLSVLLMSEIWGGEIVKNRKRKKNQEANTEGIIREKSI